MRIEKIITSTGLIFLFIFSILLSLNLYIKASIFISFIANIVLIYYVKKIIGNYISITLFFLIFSLLYGLSGPINIVLGGDLHPIYPKPYQLKIFISVFNLSNIGLILGIMFSNVKINRKKSLNHIIDFFKINNNFLINHALIFVFIGSLFELINFFRVGGINTLLQQKAVYQSEVTKLFITLPSSYFVFIGFALVGLYLGINFKEKIKFKKSKLILAFVLFSPFLLINLFLGKRGLLVGLFLIVLVGITFFKPIKRLKLMLVLVLIIVYIFMGFLRSSRGLIGSDIDYFFEEAFQKERILSGLNPATSEFEASFGNFSTFYNKYGYNFSPKLGETYIKGLVIPIPSFIYPGDKPKQIGYEFRDEFFPAEAKRGIIAGTGYSFILEAYTNFKFTGILLMYFIIGWFLIKLDLYYKYKSLIYSLVYIVCFPMVMTFHRTSFGGVFSNSFLKIVLLLFYVIILNLIRKQNHS